MDKAGELSEHIKTRIALIVQRSVKQETTETKYIQSCDLTEVGVSEQRNHSHGRYGRKARDAQWRGRPLGSSNVGIEAKIQD